MLNVFDIYHLDKEKNVHIVELHLYLYLHLPNEVFQQLNHRLKSMLIDKNCSINQKKQKEKQKVNFPYRHLTFSINHKLKKNRFTNEQLSTYVSNCACVSFDHNGLQLLSPSRT